MNLNYSLGRKDKQILTELDVNARQSYHQIAKKAGLSKEVVKYRIDRLIKNHTILRFHTVINYFKLGLVKFKLYLRLTNTNKEKLEEIAQYFHKHSHTEWVAQTTGRWDIIVGFLVHNVNEFDREVQQVLNLFSTHIQEKYVTTTLYLSHETRGFLSRNTNLKRIKIVYHTSQDQQEKIDKIDEEVLRLLANNARLPATEIAQKLNLTPRIIQYRMKELEKKKIILAYKVHLNPKMLGRIFCKALIYLSTTTEKRLNSFITYTSSLPEAIWPQRVMGNWDFELDMELENYDDFQNKLFELKEKFPDVIKNHEFCIVSKEFKLDLYPNCHQQIN